MAVRAQHCVADLLPTRFVVVGSRAAELMHRHTHPRQATVAFPVPHNLAAELDKTEQAMRRGTQHALVLLSGHVRPSRGGTMVHRMAAAVVLGESILLLLEFVLSFCPAQDRVLGVGAVHHVRECGAIHGQECEVELPWRVDALPHRSPCPPCHCSGGSGGCTCGLRVPGKCRRAVYDTARRLRHRTKLAWHFSNLFSFDGLRLQSAWATGQ
mmetsp:Transcript_2509/g.3794  ORF Transcript_2509/g.3794 Transcript_2509/m.3794 type:complete len:212 (+) Transcript_2509:554-1189(+)